MPAELAAQIQPAAIACLRNSKPLRVTTRLWSQSDEGAWSGSAVLAFSGRTDREWSYIEKPHRGGDRLTPSAQRRQVAEAKSAGGIEGYRDFEHAKPDISRYKADGNFGKALELALATVPAAERRAQVWAVAPTLWPTEEAAKLYRKLKDYAAEIEVLQRYSNACPAGTGTKALAERLVRAESLLAVSRGVVASSKPAEATEAPASGAARTPTEVAWHRWTPSPTTPVVAVGLAQAAELVEEDPFREAIEGVYAEAGVQLGTPVETTALLRQLNREEHGRFATAVYIGGRMVGVVGAVYADRVRDAVEQTSARANVAAVRCRVYAAAAPKWSARIVLGPYEEVVLHAGDTQAAAEARTSAREGARLREERLAAGGREAAQQRARLVRGKDYTEWPETVKELKRQKRFDEALSLLLECVDAAEREAREEAVAPAPWYSEQAAIVFRKVGDLNAEVAILERYLASCPEDRRSTGMADRLVKAEAFRQRRVS